MGPIYQVGTNKYAGIKPRDMCLGGSGRALVSTSKNVARIINHRNGKICFIVLKDDRILVITDTCHGMLEIRKDQQRGYGWKYQFSFLTRKILARKVTSVPELLHEMNGIGQIRYTRLSWYL